MLSAGPSKPVTRRAETSAEAEPSVLDLIGPPGPAGSSRFLAIPNGSSRCLRRSQVF